MIEYSAKICPFCKASGIIEKDGIFKCRYCLSEFQLDSGSMSLAFSLLQAGDFAAALKLFSAQSSPTAAYGQFLAVHKIDENRQADGSIKPLIYAAHPSSFNTDAHYTSALKVCASSALLLDKLKKIEETRQKDYTATYSDILLLGECSVASDLTAQLRAKGYLVKKTITPSIGDLRNSSMLIAVADGDNQLNALYRNKPIEMYYNIEKQGGEISRAALIYTHCSANLLSMSGLGALCPVYAVQSDTVQNVLGVLALPRKKGEIKLGGELSSTLQVESNKKEFRAFVKVGEIKNERAEMNLAEDLLKKENYDESARVLNKLISGGAKGSKLYLLNLLLVAKAPSLERFFAQLSQNNRALSERESECIHKAISFCTSSAQAEAIVSSLLSAAEAMLLSGNHVAALSMIEAGSAYQFSVLDSFGDRLLSALKISVDKMQITEAERVFEAIADRFKTEDGAFQFAARCFFVSVALSRKSFEVAQKYNDELLKYRSDTITMLNRLCIINEAESKEQLYQKERIVLGEAFKELLGSMRSSDHVLACLKFHFDLVLSKAAKGVALYESSFDDLLSLKADGKGLTALHAYAVGQAALENREFSLARKYYIVALEEDKNCYKAYLGLLMAQLSAANLVELESSDQDFMAVGNYYDNAYKAAHAAGDEEFCGVLVGIADAKSKSIRFEGHLFRLSDYEINDGIITKYLGTANEHIYIPPSITGIGAGAFFGNASIVSVIMSGVQWIGGEAFAYCKNFKSVTLPETVVRVGANPFAACFLLQEFNVSGRFYTSGGVLYWQDKAVHCFGNGEITVKSGATLIGEKCFYYSRAEKVLLPKSITKAAPCAFYGCLALVKSASKLTEEFAHTGEGAFNDSSENRWDSLLGSIANNMQLNTSGKIKSVSASKEKFSSLALPIVGGALVKCGKIFLLSNQQLLMADEAAFQFKVLAQFEHEPIGSACLLRDYIVVPCDDNGCTLYVLNSEGKTLKTIALGGMLTKAMVAYGTTLYCVLNKTLLCVNLDGEIQKFMFNEKITCVPTMIQDGENRVIIATLNGVYQVDCSTNTQKLITRLTGSTLGSNTQSKIVRERVVCDHKRALWVERFNDNYAVAEYNGNVVKYHPIMQSLAFNVLAQPILCKDTVIVAVNGGFCSAQMTEDDWYFVKTPVSTHYTEAAVIGECLIAGGESGEGGKARLKALYQGGAVFTDNAKGDIYVVRV